MKKSAATFENIKSVLSFITGKGRKVSRSQLYEAIKQGLLQRQPDKSFTPADVDKYASTLPLISAPSHVVDEQLDLAQQKMQAEIAKLNEQRLSIIFAREKEQGKYILREEVYLELASRATVLALGLRSMFRLNAADYIRLVGGDITKADDLAAEFEKNLDIALNEYSKPMNFNVKFVPEGDENLPETE